MRFHFVDTSQSCAGLEESEDCSLSKRDYSHYLCKNFVYDFFGKNVPYLKNCL